MTTRPKDKGWHCPEDKLRASMGVVVTVEESPYEHRHTNAATHGHSEHDSGCRPRVRMIIRIITPITASVSPLWLLLLLARTDSRAAVILRLSNVLQGFFTAGIFQRSLVSSFFLLVPDRFAPGS